MSANFNPYHYWLGYPAHFMPRNHYETLGVSPQERDLNRIAQAADALASRVQNSPPGGFIMEWQQLLTSIQTAKMCLCNPSARASYDAQMGFSQQQPQQPSQGFGGASFGPPTPSAANYTGNVAAPPGMGPSGGMNPGYGAPPPQQPAAPSYSPPPPASSGATYEYSNHISSYMPPGQTAPTPQPQAVPQAPPQPGPPVPQGMVAPQAVQVPQSAPMGVVAAAAAVPMPSAPAAAEPESLFSGAVGPSPSGTSATAAVTRAYKKSLSKQRMMVVALLAVVIGLLGFIFFGNKGAMNADSGVEITANATHAGGPIALPGEGGGDDSPAAAPVAAKNGKNSKSAKNAAKTRPAGLPPSTNPAFRKVCDGIRADLGRQDTEAARPQLAELEKIASTDAEKEEFARLTALTDSVEKFVDAVAGAMGSFKSGTVVPLKNANDDRVSIVESERGKLIVKQKGEVTKYTLDNLTPRVAEFVLRRHRQKLDFNVHYGAYLATNYTPEVELAREKWTAAEEFGNDVSLLWPELDVPRGAAVAHVSHDAGGVEPREAPVELEEGTVTAAMADDPVYTMADGVDDVTGGTAVSEVATGTFAGSGNGTGFAIRRTGKKAGSGSAANTGAGDGGEKAGGDAAGEASGEAEKAGEPEQPTEKPEKPADSGEFRKLVHGARGNIEWNQIDEAKQKLAKAKPLAKTEAEQEELNRLDALAEYMGDFLEWAGRAMAAQQSMDQITIAGEHMGVVESAPGYLRLKRQGVNVTYTTDSIDPVMADFLVGKIAKDSPDNRVLYGTFHAMNPEGNRALAKQLWQEAQKQGFQTDFLMPELDVPHVNTTRRKGGNAGGPRQAQVQRLAVPTEDEQTAALAAVKQTFARDYAKEMSMVEKDKFAEKLGKQVSDKKNTPAQQYVMLQEAARVATESQRYLTAYRALLGIQERFSENTFDQRKTLVKEADAEARGSLSAAEVAECALRLGAEAYEAKNSKTEADEMLKIAEPLLKPAKKTNLNTMFKQLQQKVGAML